MASVRNVRHYRVGEKANFLFGTGVRARMRLWPVLCGRTYAFVRVENSYVFERRELLGLMSVLAIMSLIGLTVVWALEGVISLWAFR